MSPSIQVSQQSPHMIAVLKFFKNTRPDAPPLVSRTMRKLALVSKNILSSSPHLIPKPNEIWACKIIKEVNPGVNKGCFIVEPIKCLRTVDATDEGVISLLYPGSYSEEKFNGCVIVKPKYPGWWMMPLMSKQVRDASAEYAMIVDISAVMPEIQNPVKDIDSPPPSVVKDKV